MRLYLKFFLFESPKKMFSIWITALFFGKNFLLRKSSFLGYYIPLSFVLGIVFGVWVFNPFFRKLVVVGYYIPLTFVLGIVFGNWIFNPFSERGNPVDLFCVFNFVGTPRVGLIVNENFFPVQIYRYILFLRTAAEVAFQCLLMLEWF